MMLIPCGHSGWTTLWPQCLKLFPPKSSNKITIYPIWLMTLWVLSEGNSNFTKMPSVLTPITLGPSIINCVTVSPLRWEKQKPTITRPSLLNWNHLRTSGLPITSLSLRSPGLQLILNTMMYLRQHHLRKLTFSMSFSLLVLLPALNLVFLILHPRLSPSLTSVTCSQEEVYKYLSAHKSHTASGPDGVSCHMLRATARAITPAITSIFNKSLEQSKLQTIGKPLTLPPF